jgi:hypothetical protein
VAVDTANLAATAALSFTNRSQLIALFGREIALVILSKNSDQVERHQITMAVINHPNTRTLALNLSSGKEIHTLSAHFLGKTSLGRPLPMVSHML